MRQPQIPARYLPVHVVRLPLVAGPGVSAPISDAAAASPSLRPPPIVLPTGASFFAAAAAHDADTIQGQLPMADGWPPSAAAAAC
ncbi:hypothetical protein AURDEDRAFT_170802 [Auricularia subglabra TFB-10046 SS5]|nr:hypothetical protein AURDEDRAFT_170802 [Auricularia subglabra TFB-10046 SS5]